MSVSFSLISCSWLDRRSHRFSTIGEVTEVGEVSCCEEEVECHDGTESNNNNNNNGEKVSQCCRVWEKRDNIHPADGWCRKRHGRKKETKRKKKKWVGWRNSRSSGVQTPPFQMPLWKTQNMWLRSMNFDLFVFLSFLTGTRYHVSNRVANDTQ